MIVLILIVAIVLFYLLFGEIFSLLSKAFHLEGASFKKSLAIIFFQGIIAGLIGIILGLIIHSSLLLLIINTVLGFVVLHYILKHFYHNGWLKSLGVWITFLIATVAVSVLLVVVVRGFIVEPFSVSGVSMTPTYNSGDYLLVSKLPSQYSRGDVIILKDPQDPTTYLIKRIIGLPGETVAIANGQVTINGTTLSEPYLNGQISSSTSLSLGNGQYFVLGDNPSYSFDSRNFGAVNKNDIVGRVIYRLYPFASNP